MPQWYGLNTPPPAAPSADLLGSPVSRGALSQIGKRSLSSGSGRRHAWDSRPTKRYRQIALFPNCPVPLRTGVEYTRVVSPHCLVVCVRCSSEPAVWVPDREDRLPGLGAKQAAVCVVSAYDYERTGFGSGCGAEFFQPHSHSATDPPRRARTYCTHRRPRRSRVRGQSTKSNWETAHL